MATLDEILDYAMKRMTPEQRLRLGGPRDLFSDGRSESLYGGGLGLGGGVDRLGGTRATRSAAVDNRTTVNVEAAPRNPAPVARPTDADEASQVSQAGWAAANTALSPLLSDWRTSPAAALTAAIGGYGRGAYAAKQDIAAGAEKKAEAEAKRQEREAEAARQAQVEEMISSLPPEQQQRFRLLAGIGATDRAADVVAPQPKEPIKLGDALVDPDTYEVITQAPPEALSPYQQAQLALEQQRLGLEQRRLAQGSTAAPDLVTVRDPNNPSESIMIDKRTGQPFMVDGQVARPASQRDAGAAFTQSKDLRTAYDKQVADVREVVTSYGKISSGFKEESGPGDIAGIFGYMKMLDPTSVVREGEYATAQNSGGVPDYVRAQYNKLLTGEKLAPNQRREILSAAKSQIGPYRDRYNQAQDVYKGLSTTFGVDPATVVTPIQFPEDDPPPAPKTAAAPAMKGGAFTADDILNEVLGGP